MAAQPPIGNTPTAFAATAMPMYRCCRLADLAQAKQESPLNSRRIVETFEEWRARSEPMVLVTVFETIGSTYSKAGHRVLIAGNGDYQGLVSGGCLEGDLAERSQRALAHGRAVAVTYDLRDEADELFGLGVGCNGLLRVLLQPLRNESAYEPFASIAQLLLGDDMAAQATVIESAKAEIEPGATLVRSMSSNSYSGIPDSWLPLMEAGCDESIRTGQARLVTVDGIQILYAPIAPVPRLLVLGAGLDAIPLVNMGVELGWRITVADHRPAYVERGGFEMAESCLLVNPNALGQQLALERFDAIIVMSHHLDTDRAYLEQLVAVNAAYLGILGPRARKARLVDELGEPGKPLAQRLRGPVGLDIGAASPETIAVSILAEILDVLTKTRRQGASST